MESNIHLEEMWERRVAWAIRHVEGALPSAMQRDRSTEAEHFRGLPHEEVTNGLARLIMERADPTANKRFTPWLVREYAAGRLILEDLGIANETLTLFLRYAPRLKPEERDIQRYSSLAAAWEVVRGFANRDEAHSNKAQKALDRARAYEESRILRQDSDGFTVAAPLTEFAAKWWGRGTRWCTAATKGWNAFDVYFPYAPLLVITTPDREKFQLYVTSSRFEFRDVQDREITSATIEKYWEQFNSVFRSALRLNVTPLKFVPANLVPHEWCEAALACSQMSLRDIPKKFRSTNVIRACLHRLNSTSLSYRDELWSLFNALPREIRTPSFIQELLTQHPYALAILQPKELISVENPEIYKRAMQYDGSLIRYVPKQFLNAELCEIAVCRSAEALEFVPAEYLTETFYLNIMKYHPQIFISIPADKITAAHCKASFDVNFFNLLSFPKHLQRPRYFIEALRKSPKALALLPQEKRTLKRCRQAIEQEGTQLREVPIELRTKEICELAVSNDPEGTALGHVPRDLVTYDMSLKAVRHNGMAIRFVLPEFLTADLCMAAIEQNPESFCEIPKERALTRAMCQFAMALAPSVITYVPECYLDEDMCIQAIKSDPKLFVHIPSEFKTFPVCLAAVNADPVQLSNLPPRMQNTPELIMAALSHTEGIKIKWEVENALDEGVIQREELPQSWKDLLENEKNRSPERCWDDSLLDQWQQDLNLSQAATSLHDGADYAPTA